MKPLHIVHITATNPVNDIRVFQKECMTAVSRGNRVTLIVCHDHDEIVEGVHVKAIPKSNGRISRMFGLTWKMYREALKQEGDIYQLHHPDQIPAGLLLKFHGKKVVYDTHEAYRDKVLSMRWIPAKLRRLTSMVFGLYEQLTSRAWDHIVVADAYTAQAFRGRSVSVVANYPLLVPVKANPDKKNGRPILIYEGGLCDERGLQVMLEITRLLRPRNAELELLGWCCFPEDKRRLEGENVRYLGTQSLQDMYRHLCTADLGLLLLQPVPAYSYAGENTNKLFEYMWCALPVVASDFPNLRRIVESAQCGICVNPRDPEAIAASIVALLDRPELCRQMGQNGRDAVARLYNWPRAGKVLMDVYESVISDRSVPINRYGDGKATVRTVSR
jgi:glycosyltransferase involved in cell wall biosynthesis